MTFQVGLCGTDGIILASDTKVVTQGGARAGWTSNKIFPCPEKGLAYACAGERTALLAGQIFSEKCKSRDLECDDLDEVLRSAGREAWRKEYGEAQIPRSQLQVSTLIVAWTNENESRLWRLDILDVPECYRVKDKVVAGDSENPAVFIVERYYRPSPILKLKLLAAFSILSAARLNPAAISGLEIMLCRSGTCEWVPEEEIDQLGATFQGLDSLIENRLFGGNQGGDL